MIVNDQKTILITGGAGYIGSVLTRYLLGQGYRVVVADSLRFGGESLLGIWHPPQFHLAKGDIRSTDFIRKIFENYSFDGVVHLAAIVGDPACSKSPMLAREVNEEASLSLIEAIKRKKISRFVFASTCSNYGKMNDRSGYVDENSLLSPISLYAETKVAVEKIILKDADKANGFCPTVLRFATVYGVSPRMRFDLVVNEFVKELALGRSLEVFGENFWRPYCHVLDFANAISLVLKSPAEKVSHNVFNIGDTGENYQKKSIIKEIGKYINNSKVAFIHKDEDPRDYRVSFDKVKKELGFLITKTITDGIKEVKYLVEEGLIADPDDNKYRNT